MKLFKLIILSIAISFAVIFCCSCNKDSSEDKKEDTESEIVGEDISTDTLSFSKSYDNYNTIMLFSYDNDTLSNVGVTNTYSDRAAAQAAHKDFLSKSNIYTNLNIDSKTVTYTLTESGMADYASKTKDDLKNSFVTNGFSQN